MDWYHERSALDIANRAAERREMHEQQAVRKHKWIEERMTFATTLLWISLISLVLIGTSYMIMMRMWL